MSRKTNLIGYPIVIILTAIITFLVGTCNDPIKPPIDDVPKEIISFNDAVELYQSYTKNRACIIEIFESKRDSTLASLCPSDRKPKKIQPTRSLFLTKEFLNEYTSYIDKITSERKIKISGYRLYLANYPDKEKFEDGKPIPDPRRNTIFIAPTIARGNSHLGFTIFDNDDGTFKKVILEEEFKKGMFGTNQVPEKANTASFFSFMMTNGGQTSTIGNELGSYP
ncbi:hypothetical protein [Aquimarina longa]|uniref:hypothetical protein n=1 Tax=Aquimarina longa TaxID=1080221 RepID=UPI000785E2DE|nr:hypothetical protein [Aquimarina longa]